jgi:hypothetical protein
MARQFEPTEKHPAIDALLTAITGVDRKATIRAGTCTTCGNRVGEFTDALSEKEFTISGMCQTCQDEVFTEEDEYAED